MIHFYHIFCFGDYWENIVISHFNLLRINKLIFEKVYIGLVGNQRERAKEILTNLNIANLVIVNEKEFGLLDYNTYLEFAKRVQQSKSNVIKNMLGKKNNRMN